MNINKKIGKNISELRNSKGYTQEMLSDMLGYSRGHLSCIEIGKSECGIAILYKLCFIFKCDITDILPTSRIVLKRDLV